MSDSETLERPAAPAAVNPGTPRLYLIDGSGYIFRAYHALPPLTRKSTDAGGAVAGFCNMMWKLLNDMKGRRALRTWR
jgi:DNA polymerase-1